MVTDSQHLFLQQTRQIFLPFQLELPHLHLPKWSHSLHIFYGQDQTQVFSCSFVYAHSKLCIRRPCATLARLARVGREGEGPCRREVHWEILLRWVGSDDTSKEMGRSKPRDIKHMARRTTYCLMRELGHMNVFSQATSICF